MRTHFLHIGKTGGTAVKSALAPVAAAHSIELHHHAVRMCDLPPTEPLFFFIRHPLDRFVSGFNSRMRRGLPRYHVPWNPAETLAFARFKTASSLGEALSDSNPERQRQARDAMCGIDHVGIGYLYWFQDIEELVRNMDRVLLIGLQEELTEDFERLKRLLNLPQEIALPADPIGKHSTPPGFDTSLSASARANLSEWFRRDIDFYEACVELHRSQIAVNP